jgi:periplasmic divalent cation tolerance protein
LPAVEPALVVLTTFGSESDAASAARTLVEEKLAACVNVLSGVRSIYRWKDALCDEPEVLCVIKTTPGRFEALRARLVALHPYEVPEVVALPVASAHPPYLAWLTGSVG